MTYPPGPDHLHASRTAGVPVDIDPIGVPLDGSGNEAFVLLLGVGVAVLALICTLGWIVFHHLQLG
jgi:hypothetical protein